MGEGLSDAAAPLESLRPRRAAPSEAVEPTRPSDSPGPPHPPPSIHHPFLSHPSSKRPSGPTLGRPRGTRKEDTGRCPPPMEEAVTRSSQVEPASRLPPASHFRAGGQGWPREVREQWSGSEVLRSPARLSSCKPRSGPGQAQKGQEGEPRGQKPGAEPPVTRGHRSGKPKGAVEPLLLVGLTQAPGSCAVGNPGGTPWLWTPAASAAPHFSPRFPTSPFSTSCPPFSA